jgi:hypothetical protein
MRHGGDLRSPSASKELKSLDPLILTGPDAITVASQSWLEETAGLRWNALTGLYDGGRSKLVGDVLILPITGFRYFLLWAHQDCVRSDVHTVLVGAYMAIWAPSPLQILLHVYCIMRKGRGDRLTCRWSLENSVVPFLVCAKTGLKSRQIMYKVHNYWF